MVNFEAELHKLLSQETGRFFESEFAELAAADRELLAEFSREQSDASLQMEEIYDLVKEQGFLQETAAAEKARADRLALAAMGLADLLEDFCAYAGQSGSEELKQQAKLLWKNSGGILSGCGILRFGEEGETLNPQVHRVEASAESALPREQVVRVLQSGYLYQNTLIRKAAVVVSRGQEAETGETAADTGALDDIDEVDDSYEKGVWDDEQNSWY
jgi:molecular chaperone GrpE (heat shock protein)